MHFIDCALNILYPNVCGICGKIYNKNICTKCMVKLRKICKCKKHIYLTKSFCEYMYIFEYKDLIREDIIKYKFFNQPYRYKAFSDFIINNKKICRFIKKYDIIIPVPISKIRKNERGYNQSELITNEFNKHISNTQIATNILFKIKNTLPQSALNKNRRIYNLKNAYEVRNSEIIKDKKVLLFDDIYTTGSTVNECSRMLKLAGAYEIRSTYTCKRLI